MRSRPDLPRFVMLLLLAAASPAIGDTTTPAPTPQEVDRAIEAVKADPKLARKKTVRRLTWESKSDKKKKEKAETKERRKSNWKWLRWIGDLFGWIAESSRMLFWLLIAALVAARCYDLAERASWWQPEAVAVDEQIATLTGTEDSLELPEQGPEQGAMRP